MPARLTIFCFALLWTASAFAQAGAPAATLQVTVLDETRGVLPGATVTITGIDAANKAAVIAPARVPGLGFRQRQLQAARARRLLGLAPVVLAAAEVVAVVIVVVAQPEEPHQPHDERSDVEDSETHYEDPPLQAHLAANGKPLGRWPQASSR